MKFKRKNQMRVKGVKRLEEQKPLPCCERWDPNSELSRRKKKIGLLSGWAEA